MSITLKGPGVSTTEISRYLAESHPGAIRELSAAAYAKGHADMLAKVREVVKVMDARRRKRLDALLAEQNYQPTPGTRQESVVRSLDGEIHALRLLLARLRKMEGMP